MGDDGGGLEGVERGRREGGREEVFRGRGGWDERRWVVVVL